MNAVYLPDDAVDAALDREIRELLTLCFTKPQDTVFQSRRYFHEPYPNRWVIRNEAGRLVAHTGVHEKRVIAGGETYPIGGMAEVCVHPEYRGRGFVREMLGCIHPWLAARGFVYSMLFGDPKVYGSSGYFNAENLWHGTEAERHKVTAMVRPVASKPWPQGEVFLPGPVF